MLDLPDEILLQIALSLDGSTRNRDLHHLALTCRRFRNIANEALVCNAVVTPKGLPGYLFALFRYPMCLARTASRLDLYDVDYDKYKHGSFDCTVPSNWLQQIHLEKQFDIWLQKQSSALIAELYAWNLRPNWNAPLDITLPDMSAYVAILMLLFPNIEELSLTDLLIRIIPAFHDSMMQFVDQDRVIWFPRHDSLGPTSWPTLVFQRFVSKIKTLNVFPFNDLLLRPPFLKFNDFTSLEHLAVPAICVASTVWVPGHTLPPSLKSLRLFVQKTGFITRSTQNWLANLLRTKDAFPVLRHVQLYFDDKQVNVLGDRRCAQCDLLMLEYFETSSMILQHYFLKPEAETAYMNGHASSSRARIDSKNPTNYRQVCHKHE